MATAEATSLVGRSSTTRGADLAGPVTASVLVHLLLMMAYVAAFHGDVSALVCVSEPKIGRFPFECVTTGFGKGGFDGQFYYILSRDPWRPAVPSNVDLPPYRHCRVLYPALAWLLSGGGDPVLLLWALPAINLACIGVLAWLGAALANHYGRSPWWGFMLPVVLNVGAPALRDLTDPLAATAVCGLVTAWLLRWRAAWLALWAVAAVLSREQNLAIVGVVFLACWTQRCWKYSGALIAAVGVFCVWMAVLYAVYGALPMGGGNFAAPFVGMWSRWTHLDGEVGAARLPIHAVSITFVALQVVVCLVLPLFRPERTALLIALAGAALAILGGPAIYGDGHSYTRVFLWMPMGLWIWGVQTGRRWPIALMSPAALWPLFAVAKVWWQ
jgi:hypothetical protein